jgi:hypothetical protein
MRWWHWGIGVVLILYAWQWRRVNDEVNLTINSGVIPGDPNDLAAARGVDVDAYSMARALMSEDSNQDARIGIGWAIKNHARNAGVSITTLVTRNTNPNHADHNGHYGREVPGQYCATSLSPTDDVIELAQSIMSESIPDPTGGAVLWDGPAGQDAAHARNPEQVPNDWAMQQAHRMQQGYEEVDLPGVTSTVFWKRG